MSTSARHHRIEDRLARLASFIVGLITLVAAAPLLIILAALVRMRLGSPVFFRQMRPGLNGRPFELIKFRTMIDSKDEDGRLLPDAERLNSFGRYLRSTSLDEFPEIWNILKGDMNFVGPRPLLMEYVPLYTEEQWRRHEVKPGVTGWAQVNGRNALSWEEKFRLDVWYVDNRSFWLDLKIVWMTVVKVLAREGISQSEHATAEKFAGRAP